MKLEVVTLLKTYLIKYLNLNEKNVKCETKKYYILLNFLLTTIALLIAVNIYFSMIKYKKTDKVVPYYVKSNKLKEFL